MVRPRLGTPQCWRRHRLRLTSDANRIRIRLMAAVNMSMAEDFPPPAATEAIRFGSFCLLPVRRVLMENDTPIRLGNRALDILLLLVERAGEFVSNDEIVSR